MNAVKTLQICVGCGVEFEVRPCEIRKNRKYCTRACYHKNKDHSGERNPMFGKVGYWKGKTLPQETKDKIGQKLKNRVPWNKGKHGVQLYTEEWRIKNSLSKKGIPKSEEHKRKIGEANKGNTCGARGENSPYWKGGISFSPYCPKFNREFKERVRKFFDNTCVICGKKGDLIKLDVHHVNYNKNSCCDNSKPLFVTLCKSCHTKVNNNREYWQSCFEDLIMNKYSGKCYLPKTGEG